jgi:NAD(P)-dependent dehydrogenase (short-subunit alcohol dehydrogenase family)
VKAGAKAVVLLATNKEKLEAVAVELGKINPSVDILTSTANISDGKEVEELFKTISGRWGHADVLVNNAGVCVGGGDLHEVDPEEWWSNYVSEIFMLDIYSDRHLFFRQVPALRDEDTDWPSQEVNVKGPFLLAKSFLAALPSPKETPATIVNINSTVSYQVVPGMAGYSTAKMALLQLTSHIAASYPNVTAVTLIPGLVDTDALLDVFRPFVLQTPELSGGVIVWLAKDPERARFLSGRFVMANWSVDDLLARKDEIMEKNLLRIDLTGTFGKGQFED